VPELEQYAYQKDQNAKAASLNQLNALMSLDNQDYSRFRDTVGDQRYNQEWQNTLDQQALENQRYNQQWDFSQQQYTDTRSDADFSRAQTLLQMGFSSEQIAAALGISVDQVNEYAGLVKQQQLNSLRTGSGGGGGGGGGGSNSTKGSADISTLYEDMMASGDPELYLARYYQEYGIPAGQIDTVIKSYKTWLSDRNSGKYTGSNPMNPTDNGDASLGDTIYNTTRSMLHNDRSVGSVAGYLKAQINAGYIDRSDAIDLINDLKSNGYI
jgi:hypothetical protein